MIEKFEKVYAELGDAIFRFCLVRVGNRETALDLSQETFLRLWQCLCKGEKFENDRAFLFTVAHRLIIDWYRKKKSLSLERMIGKITEHESESYDKSYDIRDESRTADLSVQAECKEVLDKINTLPPGTRHPVYLRFVEDLSPKEIALVLGISANAAGVRIQRGIESLKKIYGSRTKSG